MKFIPSPHHNRRPGKIDAIVIHYTSSPTLDGAVAWFLNPESRVSAHYVIGPDGKMVQMVNDKDRAWHAGKSELHGKSNVNDFSIGIELVNWGILEHRGSGDFAAWPEDYTRPYSVEELGRPILKDHTWWAPYPDVQVDACIRLCEMLRSKYQDITSDRIVGHRDISPGRKSDPGQHFPLDKVRQESCPTIDECYQE